MKLRAYFLYSIGKISLVILFGLLLTGVPGFSQNTPVASEDFEIYELFDVSLEDILNVGMVSASQKKESVLDAPATAYIVTKDQIESRGYNNLVDLLTDIPQVEIQKNSSSLYRNIVSVRGVSGNEKLLILENGVRLTPSTGDFYILGNQFVLNYAERVEVIIGPASALYGVDAYAGIVNIITKNSESELNETAVRSSGGSYGTMEHSFQSSSNRGNFGYLISGSMQTSNEPDYNNLYPTSYGWYNNFYSKSRLVVETPLFPDVYDVADWQRWAGNSFYGDPLSSQFGLSSSSRNIHAEVHAGELNLSYTHHAERHSTSYGINPKFTSYDPDAWIEIRQDVLSASHRFESFDKRFSITSILSHNNSEINPQSHVASSLSNWQRGFLYGYSQATKLEEQISWNKSEKWNFSTGFSIENLSSLPQTGFMPRPYDTNKAFSEQAIPYIGAAGYEVYLEPNQVATFDQDLFERQPFYFTRYRNMGTYLQAIWSPSKNANLISGLRYDNNSRYGSVINPRVGMVFKFGKKISFKMLYGRSYLAPSPGKAFKQAGTLSIFGKDGNDPTIKVLSFFHWPNPRLEPEKLGTFESSINWFITPNLSLNVGGFMTKISNLINENASFTGVSNLGGVRFYAILNETSRNFGDMSIMGYSSTLNYFFVSNPWQINAYASFTSMNSTIEVNQTKVERLFNQATDNLKGGFDISFKRLSFSTGYQWNGPTVASRTDFEYSSDYLEYSGEFETSGGYFVLNSSLSYKAFDKKRFDVILRSRVTNVLDSRYYNVYVGGAEGLPKTPQDPRRINVGLEIKFN